MANNVPGLKNDFKTAFTANLDASTRTKALNRFVSAYQGEWNQRVATGTVDTTANRATFAVDKIFDFINEIYKGESHKEHLAALPAMETIV